MSARSRSAPWFGPRPLRPGESDWITCARFYVAGVDECVRQIGNAPGAGRALAFLRLLPPPFCSFDPAPLLDTALGMFHCPECGEMVVAGIPHPDPRVLEVLGVGPDPWPATWPPPWREDPA